MAQDSSERQAAAPAADTQARRRALQREAAVQPKKGSAYDKGSVAADAGAAKRGASNERAAAPQAARSAQQRARAVRARAAIFAHLRLSITADFLRRRRFIDHHFHSSFSLPSLRRHRRFFADIIARLFFAAIITS
jgi:hypothetical protein